MKTVSIEVPEQVADEIRLAVAAAISKKRQQLMNEVAELDNQMKREVPKSRSHPVVVMLPESLPMPGIDAKAKRQSKRMVKKLVMDYLRTLNGHSVAMTDVRRAINASHATTYRAMGELLREGHITRGNDLLWRAAK